MYLKEDFVKMRDGVRLYTKIISPSEKGKFPIVFERNPYVKEESDIHTTAESFRLFVESGFAVVSQHCRGTGLSEGEHIPYDERDDGLETLDYIRSLEIYCGEIYPVGGSYLASVHFLYLDTCPHDIKGAILFAQDCNRYNVIYRNGMFKSGLHGNWFIGEYKKKQIKNKNVSSDSFRTLPLKALPEAVFGEKSEAFEAEMSHPLPDDPFWQTTEGGVNALKSLDNLNIPILFTTSFHDIYTCGIMDMWQKLTPKQKSKCALLVSPYEHSGKYHESFPFYFENADLDEAFPNYKLNWLLSIRDEKVKPIVQRGRVTYYTMFDGKWRTDDFVQNGNVEHKLYFHKDRILSEETPCNDEKTYVYNPYSPASFAGGCCNTFGGMRLQEKPNSRYDILSFETDAFENDTIISGKMSAKLDVKSDCDDTCFYIRVDYVKFEGNDENGNPIYNAYSLRDDITSLIFAHKSYTPGQTVSLDFNFAPHSFKLHKGDKLRVDISSSCCNHYVPHTNRKGLFSEIESAKIAINTVIFGESSITYFADI